MKQNHIMLTFLLIFSMFLLTGCQATTNSLLGATAHDDTLIELPTQGEGSQRWQDYYLMIDFTLDRQSDNLAIMGQFAFTESVKANYRVVRDVRLWFFLLDAQKKVIAYKQVARSVSTDLNDSVTIKGELPLSAEVTAIAFGYRGGLSGDRMDAQAIWKLPSVNK